MRVTFGWIGFVFIYSKAAARGLQVYPPNALGFGGDFFHYVISCCLWYPSEWMMEVEYPFGQTIGYHMVLLSPLWGLTLPKS